MVVGTNIFTCCGVERFCGVAGNDAWVDVGAAQCVFGQGSCLGAVVLGVLYIPRDRPGQCGVVLRILYTFASDRLVVSNIIGIVCSVLK